MSADRKMTWDELVDDIKKLKAENQRMREALEDISKQWKSDEWEEEGDTEGGYDILIDVARNALKEVGDENI